MAGVLLRVAVTDAWTRHMNGFVVMSLLGAAVTLGVFAAVVREDDIRRWLARWDRRKRDRLVARRRVDRRATFPRSLP